VATCTIASPIGPLTLVSRDGALRSVQMRDDAPPAGGTPDALLSEVIIQLGDYFAGRRTDFDIPLELAGSEFQRSVWAALRTIPYGDTASYGDIARQIGDPGASRAVGLANNANPIPVIVPCHRVIGADGSLVGFGGGLWRKHHLLTLERSAVEPALF
jgi:methylated-DNA-[protein]-cysteine S-methyltransferase